MRHLFSFRNFSLVLLLTIFSFSSNAANETTAQLQLVVNGVNIAMGGMTNEATNFSKAKFSIVDYLGEPLDQFEIVDGSVKPEISRTAVLGKVEKGGMLNTRAIELIKEGKGQKIVCTVTTVHKLTEAVSTWKFYFYHSISPPDIFLGNVSQGQENVAIADITQGERVAVKLTKNPDMAKFKVKSGILTVEGEKVKGTIMEYGELDEAAIEILKRSAGKQVTVLVNYSNPDRTERRTALVFTVAE